MADAQAIIAAILDGSVDDELTAVSQAIQTRKRQLREGQALLNKVTLGPGARVRTKNLKPKYLSGLTGTVLENQAGKRDIQVQLDLSQYTGRYSHTIGIPASCLDPV